MRINNKGFMLVEVIVTSTIVLTSMLVLYSGFSKIYNNFKIKNTYYDVDGVYVAKEFLKKMIDADVNDEFNINKFLQKFSGEVNSNGSVETILVKDGVCQNGTDNWCNSIQKLYNINNIVLLEYDKKYLGDKKNELSNQTFKEYVDFLLKYYANDFSTGKYKYIVLVEYGREDTYKYANLRLG